MNKLSKYIIITAVIVIICFLAWYFSEIVWYILIAAVISLIGRPLVKAITSFSIKKFKVPNWLASIITLCVIFAAIGGIFLFITPIFGTIINEVASIDFEGLLQNISGPLHNFNKTIIKTFPTVGPDFKIEVVAIDQLKQFVNIASFSRAFSSIASFFINFAVGLFSVIFIAFFFLQEGNLLENMMNALVPDKYEENMKRAIKSIENLLSRYFIGIIIESFLITVLDTIGLYFIAGFNFKLAVIISFAAGILNVIPYVGPLAGETLGVLMGILKHYSTPDAGPILPLLIAILAVMLVTQFIDNYLFQPYIYSSSVKAHPLEIFIVILIAGYVGGVIGMLVAIPAYTVLRVFAGEFLSKFKIVQKLTKSIKGQAI